MKFEKKIDKEDIMNLPLVNFCGNIVVIDNLNLFHQKFPKHGENEIWGFDTETRPSFKKGESNQNNVSLIQLSAAKITYLIRINKIGIPNRLKYFMENSEIIKVGLSIKDDLNGLRKINDVDFKGFIDLQSIVEKYGIEETGLRKVAAIVLKKRVSKSQQLSNWDTDELTDKQQNYAATDSWVCREIYLELRGNETNFARD